jgi:ABC-type Fe3+-hydroxamate transport system substrate-binding protein
MTVRRVPWVTGLLACMALLLGGMALADSAARRVVTLAPHLAELVALLGSADRLVGVSEYSDYPDGVKRVPRVGGAGGFDLEAIIALQPDLVLGWQGGNRAQDLALMRAQGLNVHSIRGETLFDIRTALLSLGVLLGREQLARQEVDAFDATMRRLEADNAGKPPRRIFIEISQQPLMGLTGRHPFSAALEMCALENILRDSDQSALHVDLEGVLAQQPDYILLQLKPGDPMLADRQAFYHVDGKVRRSLYYDADLALRQTPRLLDAVAQVCQAAAD